VNRTAALRPGAQPRLADAWVSYADWRNLEPPPIEVFSSTWRVPPPPERTAEPRLQTIFLFNGAEYNTPEGGQGILQPVLQWGRCAGGLGGEHWSIASWHVNRLEAAHTPLIPVEPGEVLTGTIRKIGQDGARFSYECLFEGHPQSRLRRDDLPEPFYLVNVLEAYDATQRRHYPAADRIRFWDIRVEAGAGPPPVVWQANTVPGRFSRCQTSAHSDVIDIDLP
jgi:hypothetical protein